MKTWLVCVDHTDAVFYEWKRTSRNLEEFSRLTNPAGRMRTRDLMSDRPGRIKSQNTTARNTYDPRQNKTRVELQRFVKEVAGILEKSAHDNEFDKLILVAEPRTLGALKKELGPNVEGKLAEPVHHDVTQLNARELRAYLEERQII